MINRGAALALLVCTVGSLPLCGAPKAGTRVNTEPTTHMVDGQEVPPEFAYKPWEFEGKKSLNKYWNQIMRTFTAGEFAELEAIGVEIRKPPGARFPGGSWKLERYYLALQFLDQETEKEYTKQFELLDAWEAQIPDSIAEPIARATLMKDYARFAKHSEPGSPTTEAQTRLFASRLQRAREILEAAKPRSSICPYWYYAMQDVALAQNWDRKDFDVLFEEGTQKFPDYSPLYSSKVWGIRRQWDGAPDEWETFAREVGHKTSPQLYSRMVEHAAMHAEDFPAFLKENHVDWPLMKTGYEQMIVDFPHSVARLNVFCKWAVAAGDKETARMLFEKIDGRYHPPTWPSPEAFDAAAESVK